MVLDEGSEHWLMRSRIAWSNSNLTGSVNKVLVGLRRRRNKKTSIQTRHILDATILPNMVKHFPGLGKGHWNNIEHLPKTVGVFYLPASEAWS